MDNNISDSNIVDKPDGNTFYEQYVRDISTSNIDFEPFLEENHDTDSLKKHESSANNKEGIGVKVKGATISPSLIEITNFKEDDGDGNINKDIDSSSNGLESASPATAYNDMEIGESSSDDPIEDLVREWEAQHKKLTKAFRKIARIAALSGFNGDNDTEGNKKHPFTNIEEMLLNRRRDSDTVVSNDKSQKYMKGWKEEL